MAKSAKGESMRRQNKTATNLMQ